MLSKLRLSNAQVDWYDNGAAPDVVARATRALAEGDKTALLHLVRLTANPDLPTYNAPEAAKHMLALAKQGNDDDITALLSVFRGTNVDLRELLKAGAPGVVIDQSGR